METYGVCWTVPRVGYRNGFHSLNDALEFVRGHPDYRNVHISRDVDGNPDCVLLWLNPA